jgi:hypothetical protein
MPGRGTVFYPYRRHCQRCPPWNDELAGSLRWQPVWPTAIDPYAHLDSRLLLRELDLELAASEAAKQSLTWAGNNAILNPLNPPQETSMDTDAMLRVMQMRTKAQEGTISDEELREAVRLLREGRTQAARTSANRTTKPKIDGAGVLALFGKPAAT